MPCPVSTPSVIPVSSNLSPISSTSVVASIPHRFFWLLRVFTPPDAVLPEVSCLPATFSPVVPGHLSATIRVSAFRGAPSACFRLPLGSRTCAETRFRRHLPQGLSSATAAIPTPERRRRMPSVAVGCSRRFRWRRSSPVFSTQKPSTGTAAFHPLCCPRAAWLVGAWARQHEAPELGGTLCCRQAHREPVSSQARLPDHASSTAGSFEPPRTPCFIASTADQSLPIRRRRSDSTPYPLGYTCPGEITV